MLKGIIAAVIGVIIARRIVNEIGDYAEEINPYNYPIHEECEDCDGGHDDCESCLRGDR